MAAIELQISRLHLFITNAIVKSLFEMLWRMIGMRNCQLTCCCLVVRLTKKHYNIYIHTVYPLLA